MYVASTTEALLNNAALVGIVPLFLASIADYSKAYARMLLVI